ncbi:MAG TPA: hypothetical protein VE783_08805 [Candidatus Limnocylindrales bacterium]|nr:hypothetical protein [Candidatus Limnocylindrales bacterium]
MLDKQGHIQQAKHNEALAQYLEGAPYPDWRSTAYFYAALHYVQAYFVSRTPPQNFKKHSDRDTAIESDGRIGGIWSDYRSLKDWSQNARYIGRKPSDAEIKNDILKSLAAIKKEISRHVPID